MSVLLPPPVEVRAIIVGVEHYPGLGGDFNIPGAAVGALEFAKWLVQRAVPRQGIDLWLAPRGGAEPNHICTEAGLGGLNVRRFTGPDFRHAMMQPQGEFETGSFLVVYYCGHGVIWGPHGFQYLVQPEATERQFLCFETGNWRHFFKGPEWHRFRHQLWIIDACRESWGEQEALLPNHDEWSPGQPSAVAQCAMFACASGQAARVDAQQGPRFTRALIETLNNSAGPEWPAFDRALADTAARLRADPESQQSPTMFIGEDWHGMPMVGPGLEGSPCARCSKVSSGRTTVSSRTSCVLWR